MSIKNRIIFFDLLNFSLITIFILCLFCSPAFCQTSSSPLDFTKKEIAFFKWGKGENEVPLKKVERFSKVKGSTEIVKREMIYWPRGMKIDGDDNIYFSDGNGRIFVVSSDGGSVRKISIKKTGGIIAVDENGGIYGIYSKEGPPYGFIRTKPDGTQDVFKNFDLGYVENGIAYPSGDKKTNWESPVTIFNNENNPGKLPPILFSRPIPNIRKADFKEDIANSIFLIDTQKINQHLKRINKKIITENMQVKIEMKNGKKPELAFLGIDDDGRVYILDGYPAGPQSYAPWTETYVTVFTQEGKKLTEIKIDPDYFDKQILRGELALNIRGDIFQMLASEDGVHILKWQKK